MSTRQESYRDMFDGGMNGGGHSPDYSPQPYHDFYGAGRSEPDGTRFTRACIPTGAGNGSARYCSNWGACANGHLVDPFEQYWGLR